MAAKKKASTKKDLEAKIAELEAKLSKLSSEIDAKPAEVKPAETKPAEVKPAETKPAETKPAETKPAETAKPKPTLPKGTAEKSAEAPKPQEAPKPAETTAQPPATPNEALESAYYDSPTSDFHQYRAKVTGYSPAPNRYFVRMTAPVGKVPTTDWNQQKATVTGYTACSNQYYATRARLAYHPADKRFGSFSGVNMSFDGVEIKEQTQQAPPPPPPEPPKPSGTLPKGMGDAPQTSASSGDGKSRQEQLAEYEKDYLQRIEQEKAEREQAYQEALEAEVEARAKQSRGSLPKGFEPAPEPEPEPAKPKGTLPKGF